MTKGQFGHKNASWTPIPKVGSQEQRLLEPESKQESESGTWQRIPGIFAKVAGSFPVPFLPRLLPFPRLSGVTGAKSSHPWLWHSPGFGRKQLR